MDTDMGMHTQGLKSMPSVVVAKVLAALEAGQEEILADDVSQQVKKGLGAEPAVYLRQI